MVNNSAHFFRIMEKKTENWNEIMICLCFCYGNMTDTRYECEDLRFHFFTILIDLLFFLNLIAMCLRIVVLLK